MKAAGAGLAGMGRGRLRAVMALFFLALALPTAVLVFHAYGQLKWEAFHQYRELAEELSRRVDQRATRLLAAEEARRFEDYRFLLSEGAGEVAQRSALSGFPVRSEIPGLIGWFQVDPDGALTTPLLPDAPGPPRRFGLSVEDMAARGALENRIESILGANRLVGGRPARPARAALRRDAPPARMVMESVAPASAAIAAAPPSEEAAGAQTSGAGSAGQVASSAAAPEASNEAPLASISAAPGARPETVAPEARAPAMAHSDDAAPAALALPEAEGDLAFAQRRAAVSADAVRNAPSPVPASPAAAPEPAAQAAFDELKSVQKQPARRRQAKTGALGRVEELNLSSPYETEQLARKKDARRESADAERERALAEGEGMARQEWAASLASNMAEERYAAAPTAAKREPQPAAKEDAGAMPVLADSAPTRIRTFESELDPFDVSLLDSGHFVLYRKVWRDGQRFIQGALIEREAFLAGLLGTAFQDTALSRTSNLLAAWQGDVLAEYSGNAYRSLLDGGEDLAGALLHRARLSAPLADLELLFSVTRLPVGPGATVIAWSAGVLGLVLVAGVWLMYRLGLRQLALARQQQDFVSAVSHELRTPITSIRMYAEMLREGWASEEKKRGYYAYIVQESERLSRLIANVLQLARMTRNEFNVQPEELEVSALLDGVRSQVSSQVEHAGFELSMDCSGAAAAATVRVDPDAFSQCVINLVDNALKFSAGAERKVVEVGCHLDGDGQVNVTVRDHGPGVARNQMKKIFTLFYRSESELTRETVGTGIGLALVHQLVRAMGGRVDVANADPGARFTLRFPARRPAAAAPAPASG